MRIKYLAILLIISTLSGCSSKTSEKSDNNEADGNLLKSIQLTDLSGKPIDLEQFKGKTIFINFWATWCRPCIEEMPSIAKAKEIFSNKNIVFLFASDEDATRIESFKNKSKLDLPYVIATNLEELSIQVLPTTYIFNSAGELSFSEAGSRKWDSASNLELINQIIDHD